MNNLNGENYMQRLFKKPHMYLMLCIFLCPLSLKAESRILDLDDSIRIALQYNPQVEIARQQFAGSQAVLTQAKSLYWPHLTAGGVRKIPA